jgi:uncharacterized phage protein gp47/JayE
MFMLLDDNMILLIESPEQIYERVANKVKDRTPIEQGEFFYDLAFPICQEIAEQQKLMQYAFSQAFVLWADDEFLDLAGQFHLYPRKENEDNESYRQRLLSRTMEEEGFGRLSDYEKIARDSGAGEAMAIEYLRNENSIDIFITDPLGNPADEILCQKVNDEIQKNRQALTDIEVHSAITNKLLIEVKLFIQEDSAIELIEAEIQKKILEYIRSTKYVRYNVIASLLLVPGVDDYEGLLINGTTDNCSTPDGAINVLEWSRIS